MAGDGVRRRWSRRKRSWKSWSWLSLAGTTAVVWAVSPSSVGDGVTLRPPAEAAAALHPLGAAAATVGRAAAEDRPDARPFERGLALTPSEAATTLADIGVPTSVVLTAGGAGSAATTSTATTNGGGGTAARSAVAEVRPPASAAEPVTTETTLPPPDEPWYQTVGRAALGRISYPYATALPGWTISFLPGRSGLLGGTWTYEKRIEIYVRDYQSVDEVAFTLAHELGHGVDVTLLSDTDRQRWKQTRGLGDGVPWWVESGATDFSSGSGDWAEAFAVWQVGGPSHSRVAGQPTAPELAVLARLARA